MPGYDRNADDADAADTNFKSNSMSTSPFHDDSDQHRLHRHDRHRSSQDPDRDRDGHRGQRHRSRTDANRDRARDQDRDRSSHHQRHHRRSRSRSRPRHGGSRSRSRSRHRQRGGGSSRSRSRSKSGRISGFDVGPLGMPPPLAAAAASSAAVAIPPVTGGGVSGMSPVDPATAAAAAAAAALAAIPVQAMTQQATRHARRVYVGGLPPLANEQAIASFFNAAMSAVGGNTAGPGDAVVNVYINHDKKFAFVEMRSIEEASNAMALHGIHFEGLSLKIRRPTDYNPSLAAALGPSEPSPHLNLAAVGLNHGPPLGPAVGPDRVFVGGLPYYLTESQIRELLESFGPLKGFDFVRDRDTGNSKGYAFCVFQNPGVTDIACEALNGLKMGDKTLTVRRATVPGQNNPDNASVLAQVQQQIALQKYCLGMGGILGPAETPEQEDATRVLCLKDVVSVEELKDDEEYEAIVEDMRDECSKHGSIKNLQIPRPAANSGGGGGGGEENTAPGVGHVFVEYDDAAAAARAKAAINGRKFGDHIVVVVFFPEDKFANGDYSL